MTNTETEASPETTLITEANAYAEPVSETVSHATFQAPELEEVAALFPSYDVYSLIACGGMGAVYHANQRSLDRGVAIKILPREFSQDAEFRVSFEAEAKAMAKLNHPNLIGVYDFGDVAGLLFIIMEYVPGSSLYAASNGRVVHQDDALKMVIDVCRGLAHAHHYGILHRDIKPSNILMDANANPKIGDFGLASVLGNQVQEGAQIFGTPGYTAPEVTEPPHTFDHRADIFSVGVMLHELIMGITPDGEVPLSALPQVANPRLRATIQRATNPNPNARHASAEELALELENIAATANNPLLTSAAPSRGTARVVVARRSPAMPTGAPIVPTRAPVVPARTSTVLTRGARPYIPPKAFKKNSSGGGIFLLLLLIVAVAAIYFFVIRPHITEDSIEETPKPAAVKVIQAQPTIQQPTRRKTVAQEGVKPIDNVDAFFVRAEGIMKESFKTDIDNYRQALKTNAESFETQTRQAISGMDASATATPLADLASTMQSWKNQNYLMTDSLPASLGNLSAVQQIFAKSHASQLKTRARFYQRLRSEQASYIRGLKKQIERYHESRDFVAISLLEKETARLGSEPGYYEFLMTH
jgi:serine/threonine protein kinase